MASVVSPYWSKNLRAVVTSKLLFVLTFLLSFILHKSPSFIKCFVFFLSFILINIYSPVYENAFLSLIIFKKNVIIFVASFSQQPHHFQRIKFVQVKAMYD